MVITNSATAMVFEKITSEFRKVEFPFPYLKSKELLIKILYSTICTSDLHTYYGRRKGPLPSILGHEIIGEVSHLGSDGICDYYGNKIKLKDKITWSVYAHDHHGEMALKGIPQKSKELFKYGHEICFGDHPLNGGFATHIHLKEGTDIFKLPENLTLEEATPLNCTHATIAGALRLAGELINKNVLIVGAGMLGLSAMAMSAESGAAKIVVMEINPERILMAKKFGASFALDSDNSTHAEQLKAIGGIDVIIETSGNPDAIEQCINYLNIGGIAIWIGAVFSQRNIKINAEYLVRNLLTIKGLHNYIPSDLHTAIIFLEKFSKKYPFHNLVKETFSLSDLQLAFETAQNSGAYRIGIKPN